MDVNVLQRQFARIGARVQVTYPSGRRATSTVALDIARDRDGELFDIRMPNDVSPDVEVLHLEPQQRHLLLLARTNTDEKHKFLCGHDERHWFVAAVPEKLAVSTVRTAMEALKPVEIQRRQDLLRVRPKNRNRRRNEAFVRQGEWFFVPVSYLIVNQKLILTNEPLRRGGGKPHVVEQLYRVGGETVYVTRRRPNGLTQSEFDAFVLAKPTARSWAWRTMRRDPIVYVRGRVRHADHATIELRGWHQVLMNTETQAAAMRHVAFLD